MSRHVAAALVAVCALRAVATADEPAGDADQAEQKALRERGLVFKAKPYYFAILLAGPRDKFGNDLNGSVIYFGDGKTFYRQWGGYIGAEGNRPEERTIDDLLALKVQGIERSDAIGYQLACGDRDDYSATRRVIKLEPVADAAARKLTAAAKYETKPFGRKGYALAREGTTYYYVDRSRGDDTTDFRIFTGKRGALKPLKIKEQMVDSKGGVFVTPKGVLQVALDPLAVSWGKDDKHLAAMTAVPVDTNRKLVHLELGVYARQRTGAPCHDL